MNITKVSIYPLEDNTTKALATIEIGNDFIVSGLRVLSGKNGLWVSMPSRKNKEGTVDKNGKAKPYSDVCFPITREAREEIQNAVISKYDESNNSDMYPTKNKEQENYIGVKEEDLPF